MNLRPDGFPSAGDVVSVSMSADGRIVAFAATADDLVPSAPDLSSIYVRDRATGAIVLVSRDSGGVAGNGPSTAPFVSADGYWVAFTSHATNLVALDANGVADAFVHDLLTGATERVSVDDAGADPSFASTVTSISAEGRYVVFHTNAALVATDTNERADVYVRDRVLGTNWRASLGVGGDESLGTCTQGSISGDGNRVAFLASANDMWPGVDVNGITDVYVRDRALATTELVSRSTAGAASNFHANSPRIARDGHFVVFTTAATTLDPLHPTNGHHAFGRDLVAGTTSVLDLNSAGVPGASALSASAPIAVSRDGRFVAFASPATNLATGDTNGTTDVFVRDLVQGTTERASFGAVEQQVESGGAHSPAISDDGLVIAFVSAAENLMPADPLHTNDLHVRDLLGAPTGSTHCAGDAGACPCANGGLLARGCGHSEDPLGAGFVAFGVPSLANDTSRIGGYELPITSTAPNVGVFIQGTTLVNGGGGSAFGDGLRCIGGNVVRLATKALNFGEEVHYPGFGEPSLSSTGLVHVAGSTRYYQLWYRDSATYCTADPFNLTNAVGIVWAP